VADRDPDTGRPAGFSRRQVLTTGAAALGGAVAGAGLTQALPGRASEVERLHGEQTVAFHGEHQAGVATPPQAFVAVVALDLRDGVDREALVRLMRIWTDDIERLTQGRGGLADTEPELAHVPARLSVTVGVGPAVFSAAGLEAVRPSWLAPLPDFTIDRLQERWTGGDLVLQICADDEVTVARGATADEGGPHVRDGALDPAGLPPGPRVDRAGCVDAQPDGSGRRHVQSGSDG
jgi:dye decolorizing peroxidase